MCQHPAVSKMDNPSPSQDNKVNISDVKLIVCPKHLLVLYITLNALTDT